MARRVRRRVALVALILLVLAGAGAGAAASLGAFSGPSPSELAAERAAERAAAEARARARLLAHEQTIALSAEEMVAVPLPTEIGSPAPAAPAELFGRPIPRHLVIGFVPYWSLGTILPADLADTSVVAYYGVSPTATGALDETGQGWADFEGAAFNQFVAAAHAAHDRVLLTLSLDDAPTIARLLSHPRQAALRLAAAVDPLLVEDRLDGVDLDIEGRSTGERASFVRFVEVLTNQLRNDDPPGEWVLDTYPQSAAGSSDFFDVKALAPFVSQLFVMGYDMQDDDIASADAPLASPSLGLSDVQSLLEYERLVPPAKLVLGVPFYGYDFTTVDGSPGAPTLTGDPVAVDYSAIAAAAHPAYWDPGSLTPYSRFSIGKKHHQTWYDDPVSIALKTALAARDHLAGMGVWALGAEGSSTAMLRALDGTTGPLKLPVVPAP